MEDNVVPRRITVTVLTAGLLLAAGATPAYATDAPPRVTKGPCQYTETPDEPAARPGQGRRPVPGH